MHKFYRCVCGEWTQEELDEIPKEVLAETKVVGHRNQAGGFCCPDHGNTCGFHHQYDGEYLQELVSLVDFLYSDAFLLY